MKWIGQETGIWVLATQVYLVRAAELMYTR